jgi:putative PIN family toxin of toxin-antitoxin system
LKIVLDTNVLLISVSDRSPVHWVFKGFLDEEYTLCVTSDILLEYEEILTRHMGAMLAEFVMQAIENAVNTEWVTKFFHWNLITADPDDNKFVDCAIACQAKFIVTEDKHFQALKQVDFPNVEVVSVEQFKDKLEHTS